jgi:hypothetical protein
VGEKKLGPFGLMLFSVGDGGALLAGGAVVVVVVVVLVVVGVWLPLVPQAVVNAPIVMRRAPPATASRRRSTLRAFMCNSISTCEIPSQKIRATIGSAYCHHWSDTIRGQWPWVRTLPRPSRTRSSKSSGTAQRSAVSRTTILSCPVPPSHRIIAGQPVCEQWGLFIVAYRLPLSLGRRPGMWRRRRPWAA